MSFIERFQLATIGFSGYSKLGRDRANGFGYMSLLLLIVLAISALVDTVRFGRMTEELAQQLASSPNFALENGTVRFEGPMPYRLETGDDLFIVDTTGQTTVEELQKHGNGVLVTKDRLYQVDGGRIQEQDLRQIPLTITRDDVVRLVRSLTWVVPLGYLLIYPFQVGFKALDAVVLALLAMLYGGAVRRKVPFDLGFKLGLYAITLPTIVQWLFPGFTTLRLQGFALWWGLAILYLLMGLRSYLRDEDPTETVV
jgi:hypothetical protein